ncbi:MAG: hypothetical protein ABH851_01795 [Methanobacteriota archaeon]
MDSVTPNEMKLVLRIAKDVSRDFNANSLAEESGLTAMGALKILKRLEKQGILKSRKLGRASFYKPDYDNNYAKTFLQFLLEKEAEEAPSRVKRWIREVRKLEGAAEMAVLFGSILDKEGDDVDMLVVLKPEDQKKLDDRLNELNEVNVKRIHPVKQTVEDFTENIRRGDKVVLTAVKNGVVAFGYGKIVEALENVAQ